MSSDESFVFIKTGPGLFDGHFKCVVCGQRVERGIISVSTHWADCSGKDFFNAAMENAQSGRLSLNDIENLRQRHL